MKTIRLQFAAIFLSIAAVPAVFAAPTFDKDIAPIVFKNCAVCHRPGEVAPFSLLDYRDVSKRAKQIARVTGEKIMPPWKAEPGFGEFANDRHLTAAQIDLFKEWAAANAPEGDSADLPPAPQFADTWSLGKPDVVLEPDEDYELSAEGSDIYRCFVIPSNFTEDHFIRALEVQPGNRKVVHHVIVHYDTSGRARELDAQDPGPGYTSFGGVGFRSGGMIGGWAPGNYPSLSSRRHWPPRCRKGRFWSCRFTIINLASPKKIEPESPSILRTAQLISGSARFPSPNCSCAFRRAIRIISSTPRSR